MDVLLDESSLMGTCLSKGTAPQEPEGGRVRTQASNTRKSTGRVLSEEGVSEKPGSATEAAAAAAERRAEMQKQRLKTTKVK